jgi:hypothetical protein
MPDGYCPTVLLGTLNSLDTLGGVGLIIRSCKSVTTLGAVLISAWQKQVLKPLYYKHVRKKVTDLTNGIIRYPQRSDTNSTGT